ncbi:EAL domain-containing protein, partial [Pseudoalteromonas shioyasakiensis]
LSTPLEKTDYIARFSADEFIVILSSEPSSNHEKLTQLLIDSFNSPLKLHDQLIFTSISVGICRFPNDGKSVRTLLQCAETAMYDAKENGRSQFRIYNKAMSDSSHFQIEISQHLRESLIHEEFHLVYQPIYCAKSEKIVACEALLRWDSNANKNNTTPDTFIPIAEKVGLMIPIGNLIFHMALKELKKWRSNGINDVRMLINISGKQLLQKEFFSQLSELLEIYE